MKFLYKQLLVLCACLTLTVVAQAEGMQVSSVSGQAWVGQGNDWTPLQAGDYVPEGAWVTTAGGTGVELIGDGGSVLRAGSDTLLAVTSDGALHLKQGGALMTGQGRQVVTPEGTFTVSGEAVALSMQNGFRALNLAGGGALTFSDGKQVSLEPGQLASATPGGTAGPVVDIDLAAALGSSFLMQGFETRLPGIAQVERAASEQSQRVERGEVIRTGYRAVAAASETQMALARVQTDVQQTIRREQISQERLAQERSREVRRQQALAHEQQRQQALRREQLAQEQANSVADTGSSFTSNQSSGSAVSGGTGTLQLGTSTSMGTLTVTSDSIIDFGGVDTLLFPLLDTQDNQLTIQNWTGGDSLIYNTANNFYPPELPDPVFHYLPFFTAEETIHFHWGENGRYVTRQTPTNPSFSSFDILKYINFRDPYYVPPFFIPYYSMFFETLSSSDYIVTAGQHSQDIYGATYIYSGWGAPIAAVGPAGGWAWSHEIYQYYNYEVTDAYDFKFLAVGPGSITVEAGNPDAQISGNYVYMTKASLSSQNAENRVGLIADGSLELVDMDTFSDRVRFEANDILRVEDVRFNSRTSAPMDIAMSARTIALQDVDFPGDSRVSLSSEVGRLAENPNTNRPVLTGYVNFVQDVTYGQQPAQNYVDASVGGAGSFGGQGPIEIHKR